MRKINGFDYRLGMPVTRTMKEWRDTVTGDVNKGLRRRVEGGETFIHDGARLQYEIYANVAPRATGPFAGAVRDDWQATNGKAGPVAWKRADAMRRPPFAGRAA